MPHHPAGSCSQTARGSPGYLLLQISQHPRPNLLSGSESSTGFHMLLSLSPHDCSVTSLSAVPPKDTVVSCSESSVEGAGRPQCWGRGTPGLTLERL